MPVYDLYNRVLSFFLTNTNTKNNSVNSVTLTEKKTYNLRPRKQVSYK